MVRPNEAQEEMYLGQRDKVKVMDWVGATRG